jgi:hypothetical protein
MQSDVGAYGSQYAGIIVIVIVIGPRHGYRHPHRDPRCDTMTMMPTLNSLNSVLVLAVILVLSLRTACALAKIAVIWTR